MDRRLLEFGRQQPSRPPGPCDMASLVAMVLAKPVRLGDLQGVIARVLAICEG